MRDCLIDWSYYTPRMPKELSDVEKKHLELLRSGWAQRDEEKPFKKRIRAQEEARYGSAAMAALLSLTKGAYVINANQVAGHPLPSMLQYFARNAPSYVDRQDFYVEGSTIEGQPSVSNIHRGENLRESFKGEELASVITEFQERINVEFNNELNQIKLPDGRIPSITFSVLQRNIRLGPFDTYLLDPHQDRYDFLDPSSDSNDKLIGMVVVPMERSSATLFESETQTIIPSDGNIVFFHPKEVHRIPPDITATYDGVNDWSLVESRSIVLGIVEGSDGHDMSKMADAIATGLGMGMKATFLEGTTHVSEIQEKDADELAARRLALEAARDEERLALEAARDDERLALEAARDDERLALEAARDEERRRLVEERRQAAEARAAAAAALAAEEWAAEVPNMYIIGTNTYNYTSQVVLLPLVYFALCFLSRRLENDAVANLQKAKEAVENLDGTQKKIAQQEVERAKEILRRRQYLKNICPRSSTTHE